jgi:hypothetical protein
MRKLIEQYRRKPDFDADNCTPIVLADGQEWYFAKPWLEVRPIFRDAKVVAGPRMLTCRELDPLIEAIGAEENPMKQAWGVLNLGALILLRSYDLDDAELGRLFILRPGDADSDRMLREIIEVATGRLLSAVGPGAITDPKARGGGSGSA